MSSSKLRIAVLAITSLAAPLLIIVSSSGANAVATKPIRVGVIYLDTQGFYGGVKKGIQDGAAALGKNVSILENNALDDASKESTFFNSLIAQKVDAIIVSASSATASIPAIKAAHAAGIPVICYNTCIQEPEMTQYVSAYTLGDPITFGYNLGIAAAAYFTKAKIKNPKFAVVNCEFVEVCVQRRAGFDKAMKLKLPGYKIVANQKGGDASASLTAAQNMLTANPKIDAFMGEYGDATVGAIKAVKNAGRTGKIAVFGGDMTKALSDFLISGKILKAQVDISGQTMGRAAIKAAVDIIAGHKPAHVVIPVKVDLYTNAKQAAGWAKVHADGIP
jgi:ABC-type sugar transport system substrate-binding protein